ncbi:unnamed protein product [Chilo suppressalis]|uniref:Uncharacterized protein n=1 Tax=Chilo suppressalis TaxID=168631 RepID=A0ABN8AZL9_CHISP|nr:unnamed protein product [Chilo suppressalis]
MRLRTSKTKKARVRNTYRGYFPWWEEASGGNAYEMCAHAAAALQRKRRRNARNVRTLMAVGVNAEICHSRGLSYDASWQSARNGTSAPSGVSACAAPVPQGPQLGPAQLAAVPAPAEVTFRPNMAARAGSAQLTYRDIADGGPSSCAAASHTNPHAPIPISAKVRAITTLRINYPRCYLKIFVCEARRSKPQLDRHEVARANRFPAAGRLMRAGRAGAGGGSDARAHHRPSLSISSFGSECERDHDCSLSQRRVLNQ